MKKLFLILIIISLFINVRAQTWNLKKDSDGIKVYTRVNSSTNICEFKASTNVNASPDELLKLLKQTSEYPQWVNQVSSAKTILSGNNDFIVYYKIGLPVGFKDRDIVLDNKINKLSNGYKIELKTASDKYSLQNNYVRITDAYGYWLFEQNGTNSDVTYQFYSDPKGSFPSWLVNVFIVDGPYKTLKNIKEIFN